MSKKFRDLLEEAVELKSIMEAPEDELDDDPELDDPELDDPELDGEEGAGDEDAGDEDAEFDEMAPDSETDYSPDDLREIIDYVYEILDKEDDGELNDSVGEIGLDLLYDYADVLPQTVVNQIVSDLKEIFEIEDTMLESIVTEGAAFVKKKKGSIAKALAKKARKYYKKNKTDLKNKNKKWRKSAVGKKLIALHKKMMKKLGAKKGKRLVTAPVEGPAE